MQAIRIIGPGRAGRSLADALCAAGSPVVDILGSHDDLSRAAFGVDVLVLAVPDAAIARVAAAVQPHDDTAVLHLSGSLGTDVLSGHRRRGVLHPLAPLPDPTTGSARLRSGITFAVDGDPAAARLVSLLGGHAISVPDAHRAEYHAAAVISSNHVVALMGQAERVAQRAGVPFASFLPLARAALDDVDRLGPREALTGPAARGDLATLERHVAALAPAERDGYAAGATLAARLAGVAETLNGVDGEMPRVIRTVAEFSVAMDDARAFGRTVGLVPTMGALHEGHASLMERAASECDHVAVTIFVNPLQFGDEADLDRYPRTLDADLEVCRRAGVATVFAPSVREMYPDGPSSVPTSVRVEGLTSSFEGSSRPGHFDGVATVVAKLFAMTGRSRAYFGEKDFQQLAVVRRMATDLSMPVQIVPCETVRADDGLALSSRNSLLTGEQRRASAVLSRALDAGREAIAGGEQRPAAISEVMAAVVAKEPDVILDYATVVAADDLVIPVSVDGVGGPWRLLIAARVGAVRLIDNCDAGVGATVASPKKTRFATMEAADVR